MPRPHSKLRYAILVTLAYFDVFDFPLTQDELIRFLHSVKRVRSDVIIHELSTIPYIHSKDRIFYHLPKREKLVAQRQEREIISKRKIEKALFSIHLLRWIPTILFVGLSGSLAMNNGDKDSDIDLFLITIPHTLWITRALVWLIFVLIGNRRKRNTKGKDSMCVNMLMDMRYLAFPPDRCDIYTAHEVVQIVPLVDKYHTYARLLQSNQWIKKLLANKREPSTKVSPLPAWLRLLSWCLAPIEVGVMRLQLWYMRKHKTIEKVTPTYIAFHPYNYRGTIIKEFEKNIQRYAI